MTAHNLTEKVKRLSVGWIVVETSPSPQDFSVNISESLAPMTHEMNTIVTRTRLIASMLTLILRRYAARYSLSSGDPIIDSPAESSMMGEVLWVCNAFFS
jgi:hypothetical protein